MNSVGAIKPMDQDEQQLQGVISDIITTTLRDTVYPVDFSVYATCPRAEVDPLDMPVIYPVNYDALAVSVSTLRRKKFLYIHVSNLNSRFPYFPLISLIVYVSIRYFSESLNNWQ